MKQACVSSAIQGAGKRRASGLSIIGPEKRDPGGGW
jgi:hypothetical protein